MSFHVDKFRISKEPEKPLIDLLFTFAEYAFTGCRLDDWFRNDEPEHFPSIEKRVS